MNRAQRRHGEPLDLVKKKVSPCMDEMIRDFIRQSPFAVLATSDRDGNCDASPKGGQPGFAKVLDESHLLLPDIAGNKLFHSYGNIETNPKAGLVFMIPGCDWTVRVNGSVEVVDKQEGRLHGIDPEVFARDENTKILQGLLMRVDEAYAHCPRAFLFSALWDAERIAQAKEAEPNKYWLGRWKEAMARR